MPARRAPRSSTRRRRRAAGQTLVEFAIVLPFLIILIVGIADMGYYLFDYVATQTALREGARAAALARNDDNATAFFTDDQIKAMVVRSHGSINAIKQVPGALSMSSTNEITLYTTPADSAFDGDYPSVTITIQHQHQLLFPFFIFNDSTLAINGRIRVARVPGLTP